jgi:signal transduction histidine kinase/ligand-binding sensor domain-containing protein/CheY-like chemotaxis protein/AraC-like DNA-binding protein
MIRFIFLTILLGLVFSITLSQQTNYQFSHIDISKGLSNNQVNSFLKDQTGFMWIGTMSGLNRYDGYQFKVFRHDVRDTTSLSDDFIVDIAEGPAGKLWITTRNGINIYDPAIEKFERNPDIELKKLGLPQSPVTSIVKDKNGDFFILQNATALYKYDHLLNKPTLFYNVSSAGKTIVDITIDKSGQCWLIYQDGLLENRNTKTGKVSYSSDIATRFYGNSSGDYSLFADNENELWIYPSSNSTKTGVIRFNPQTNQSYFLEKDRGTAKLNSNLVAGILQDTRGDIWICTDHGGINLYNKKSNTVRYLLNNTDDDKSLSQNSIKAAYQDENGTIWLGTYKKGVSYYHENIIKFPVFRHQPSNAGSLSFEDVNRFVEDARGNIWIGTNGGGLLYFDRINNVFKQHLNQPGNTNSISNNVIVSLWIDHEQNLWIGSYFGGLDCYKNGIFTHIRHDEKNHNSLADDRVWEIFEDSKQNLWVGTLDGGLDLYDKSKNIFYHHSLRLPHSIHSNYISAILEDKEQRLWVGTDIGIDVMNYNKMAVNQIANYTSANGLSNANILSLLEDSRGLIWAGTRDGLNVFNKKSNRFKSFRTEDGLPGNTILNVLEDNKHTLWISTNNGISNIIVKGVGDSLTIACLNYDALDGLQGTEFNENAALKTSKGEIIFGGGSGFNMFYPEQIKVDQSPQHLVLTGLQLNNRTVDAGEEIGGRILLPQTISNTSSIQLKYNENILGIEFAALNFSTPQKIKYAYLLEGLNKDWVYTDGKMRKVVYTNLDPGDYTFHVKASTEDGKWVDKELSFKIEILPPLWRTSFAYFFYLLLIGAVLWFARRIILERAGMRFEAIHQRKEAERILAIDVMKTKFFTNVSHEFRTPLSLILSPLDGIVKESTDPNQKKQLHLIQRNAKRLLNLVNQLLDFRKMEVQEFSIVYSKTDFIRFAKDITCSFSDIAEKKNIDLAFKTNTESFQMLFDKDKVEKIFFNLLSNAFKYTPSNGKINVAVIVPKEINTPGSENSNVVIKISDTGIGIPADSQRKVFEPYFQHVLPGNMHNYGTGIGLAITTEFLKLLKGTIAVESESGKGTCFIVSLPVKQEEGLVMSKETVLAQVEATSLHMDIGNEETDPMPHDIKKQTILLVEDNEDFRFYLKDNLKHHYNVIVAVNGKEGWGKVRDQHPDIVVSDLMMPEMNGIELSKKIKTDPATSHIPVLLLTAMSTIEKELEGFQAGANDYVTKPFTFEILESRIQNLLNLRLQMQKKFQQELEINPGEITSTSIDEEFMKRTLLAVQKNYDNPDFSVEDLSRELFMSRVSLYKKILSITGKTPIEFIRVMRLKRAAQLLKDRRMNISEVAYEVGYNNPKIFTKYFKEEFNMTPSQFQAKNSA